MLNFLRIILYTFATFVVCAIVTIKVTFVVHLILQLTSAGFEDIFAIIKKNFRIIKFFLLCVILLAFSNIFCFAFRHS